MKHRKAVKDMISAAEEESQGEMTMEYRAKPRERGNESPITRARMAAGMTQKDLATSWAAFPRTYPSGKAESGSQSSPPALKSRGYWVSARRKSRHFTKKTKNELV